VSEPAAGCNTDSVGADKKGSRRCDRSPSKLVCLPGKPHGRKWFADPDSIEIAERIANVLDTIRSVPGCIIIKENPTRSVYHLPAGADYPALIVKHYHAHLRDYVKHLIVPTKAAAEWRAAERLRAAGIPVPKFCAMAEKRRGPFFEDACLVMEAIPECRLSDEYISPESDIHYADPEERRELLGRIVDLAAAMHERGILHRDYHGENVLASSNAQGKLDLYVIDLHRMRFPLVLRTKHRIRTVAHVVRSFFRSARREELREMCMHYASTMGLDKKAAEKFGERVLRRADRRELARTKRLTRRTLRTSNDTVVETVEGRKIYRAREIQPDVILAALDEHHSHADAGDHHVLHRSSKAVVTKTSGGLCVKEWFGRGPIDLIRRRLHGSKAKVAWVASNGLAIRRINTPQPLAMVEEKGPRGSCYLITRYVQDSQPLNMVVRELIAAPDCVAEEALGRAVGEIVGELHAHGVYHGDLSAKNFLVESSNGRWKASIVDLDNIRSWRRLTRRRRLKSLSQLNDVREGFSMRGRIAFVRKYNSYDSCTIDRPAMEEIDRLTHARAAARNFRLPD